MVDHMAGIRDFVERGARQFTSQTARVTVEVDNFVPGTGNDGYRQVQLCVTCRLGLPQQRP